MKKVNTEKLKQMLLGWKGKVHFGKNWMVIPIMGMIICVAVLLSAQFTKPEEKPETDGKVLGEEVYVKTSEDDSYFDQARYTRKQSRDEAISVFRSVIENENADSEARLEASENINEYAVRSEKETAAENQIKAKGFEECIVYIGEDNASVMVQTDGLTSEQAAQILDIVAAETNLNANVIKIIEVE